MAFRDDTGQRTAVWDLIRAKLETELPDHEIVVGTDDSEVFNKCRALNEAARRASGELFYVLDADSWCKPEQVEQVREQLTQGWARPWRLKWKLGAKDTQAILEQGNGWDGGVTPSMRRGLEIPPNGYWAAPPLMLTREAFETVGGFDERFDRGWGQEDDAFAASLRAFYGRPSINVDGVCVHLYHPRIGRSGRDQWPGQVDTTTHRKLAQRYRSAIRSPEAMRELISEREPVST